jgi:hypothetical protein
VLSRLAVFASPWPGPVSVWTSADGTSFTQAALALAPSTIGETLDDLPAGPWSRFDQRHTVRVRLYGGALASLADLQLFGGGNAAAVRRADGAWEVLQFGQADLVADKTYRLSRLLRGQLGSEWAIADLLPAGSPFVPIDRTLLPVARGPDALGRPQQLRLIVSGRDAADPSTLALDVTPQATALLPLCPVHLKARRGVDGIVLSWIRRTRADGDGWDGEVPLGEEREAYEIDILDGGSVVRTLASDTAAVLYAEADQLADFGAPQSLLTFAVSQISAVAGRGHAAQATCIP